MTLSDSQAKRARESAHKDTRAAKHQRIEAMRGRCHERTKEEWGEELGVAAQTAFRYARDLGEECKPSEHERCALASREFDASLMQRMATMPLGARR